MKQVPHRQVARSNRLPGVPELFAGGAHRYTIKVKRMLFLFSMS
jgi:hypothetical protein